jgi:hypothetical protein
MCCWVGISTLPPRWPHFFSDASWSSQCEPATPAAIIAGLDISPAATGGKRETTATLLIVVSHSDVDQLETLDMLRAVQTLLPRDSADAIPENPADRQELLIDRMDCQYFPDLSAWFATLTRQWAETHVVEDAESDEEEPAPPAAVEPVAEGEPAAASPDATAAVAGQQPAASSPAGAGWVVELQGHHFHNEDRHKPLEGAQYVRSTLIQNLLGKGDKVIVSAGPLAGQEVSVSDLGIGFPVEMLRAEGDLRHPVRMPRRGAFGEKRKRQRKRQCFQWWRLRQGDITLGSRLWQQWAGLTRLGS